MDWNLKIIKAENGYIAEYWDEGDDGEILQHQQVFEEQDDEKGELDCMVNLLNFVKEHFGHYGSKHDHYRLLMEIVDQRTEEKRSDE